MNDMMKSGLLVLWMVGLTIQLIAQAPKIVQRDLNPPQRMVAGGGEVIKVEYTNHKMIIYFVSDNQTRKSRPRTRDDNFHSSQTIYGPGHPNSWRLYDKKNNREYALLYVKNIKAVLDDGRIREVDMLDEPVAARFNFAQHISCEAHFERPGKGVDQVDLIEEDVESYRSQTSSQEPYNVYDLRVMAYKDDMRNASPPVRKPVATAKPKPTSPSATKPPVIAKTKPTVPATPKPPVTAKTKPPVSPAKKPVPKPAPKDAAVAQAPRKEAPKPAPAEKVENFGSNVEAGRTYRLNNLLFKQSAYEIESASYPELDSLVAIMKRNPTMEIELAGHTDNVGDPKLNVALSQKRVDAVKSYLTNNGIDPARIQTQAYGGSKPIADNSREETKRLNRRVEVKILKS